MNTAPSKNSTRDKRFMRQSLCTWQKIRNGNGRNGQRQTDRLLSSYTDARTRPPYLTALFP